MDTIKMNHGNVFMVGHRGVCGLEPENSIPSFLAACNRSYYGVETDVHVTRDKKFVVIHDDNTKRVAAEEISIEGSDYNVIRQVILNNICRMDQWNGNPVNDPQGRKDLIIPSLAEYISICKKYEKKCVLELKNRFAKEDIIRLIGEIRKLDYLEHMIFISFSFENMVDLRELLPDQTLQFLTSEYNDDILQKLNTYHLDLDIYYKALTKEAVEELHANGHKVNCWTCNTKEEGEQLAEWGVDFITSDILE